MKLNGVPATLVIPLYYRAVESRDIAEDVRIFDDIHSEQAMSKIDYDATHLSDKKMWTTQVAIAVRTALLDQETVNWLKINSGKECQIINLGAGLCTRHLRLEDQIGKNVNWIDLDLDEVIELRKKIVNVERCQQISGSVLDDIWMEGVEMNIPTLFIAEGLFMYFPHEAVRKILGGFADKFKNATYLFEILGWSFEGETQNVEALDDFEGTSIDFSPVNISTWLSENVSRVKYIKHENIQSHYHKRWRHYRFLMKVLPSLKDKFSNRIVLAGSSL
ncbi:MAG: class I SAM-dependent methyltransferase [Pseudomonadales bacterium]|nr:class I SAM-dependent methyltransferase [Pseudomonadales bacterium]